MKFFFQKIGKFLEDVNKLLVAPLLLIIGGILAFYFTTVKNSLETKAIRLENAASVIETELKEKGFYNNLKIQMYIEVKEAIMKEDVKLQKAVLLLLNELLANDSLFREQLITVLLASPSVDKSVKKEQQNIDLKTGIFLKEENAILTKDFAIDVFYLEDIINESEPRAQLVVNALSNKYPNYQIRLRKLPININAKSSYRISENQIRYEKDEMSIAKEVLQLIKDKNIFQNEQPALVEIRPLKPTPKYLSVYVRNL